MVTAASVSPLSQPEDMGQVNEKLSQMSTLATRSISATESSCPKPRDDGSPTSIDSSTSTLKEEGSAENIPVLVDSMNSILPSSRKFVKSPPLITSSSEVIGSKLKKAESAENEQDLLNEKNKVNKVEITKKEVVSREGNKEMDKMEDKKESKLNNKNIDISKNADAKNLNEVNSNITEVVVRSTFEEKSSRCDRLKSKTDEGRNSPDNKRPGTDVDTSDKTSYRNRSSTSRAGSHSGSRASSFDTKELKKETRYGKNASEELTKSKDHISSSSNVEALSSTRNVSDEVPPPSASSLLVDPSTSCSRSSARSPSTVESIPSSRSTTTSAIGRYKSGLNDEKYNDSTTSIARENTSQSSTQKGMQKSGEERPRSRGASDLGDSRKILQDKSEQFGRPNSRNSQPKEGSYDSTQGSQKSSSLDERPKSRSVVQDLSKDPPSSEQECALSEKEISLREKRMQRKKRRGNVEEKVGFLLTKAKQLPKQQTSTEEFPESSNGSEQKRPVNVSPSSTTSSSNLGVVKSLSSPKAVHRPTTPDVVSSMATNTLSRLEKRRKSEGMNPIPHDLIAGDAVKEETLLEEEGGITESESSISLDITLVLSKEVNECTKKEEEAICPVKLADVLTKVKKSRDGEEEKEKDVTMKLSASGNDIFEKQSHEALRQSANSSPVKGIYSTQDSSSLNATSSTVDLEGRSDKPSCRPSFSTVDREEKADKPSSHPSSSAVDREERGDKPSSRPTSRSGYRQNSLEKENVGARSKPSSPLPHNSKYTSCTSNAFTSGNSPFTAEETRPYTSVLRKTDNGRRDTLPASSLSSLARSPIDRVWKDESSTASSPIRRLSANPVRGGGGVSERRSTVSAVAPCANEARSTSPSFRRKENNLNTSDVGSNSSTKSPLSSSRASGLTISKMEARTSTEQGEMLPKNTRSCPDSSSSLGDSEGKTSSANKSHTSAMRGASGVVQFGLNGGSHMTSSSKNKESSMPNGQSTSPASSLSSKTFVPSGGKSEVARKSKRGEVLLGHAQPSPKRKFVKREEMVIKADDSSCSTYPATSAVHVVNTDAKQSHPTVGITTPEVVVQSLNVANQPPSAKSAGSVSLPLGDNVTIRHKHPLATEKRKSWRQTPEISPDVVDMILNGDLFECEEDMCEKPLRQKLATCIEEDEDAVPIRKFLPHGSGGLSQSVKLTSSIKTPTRGSPDSAHRYTPTSSSQSNQEKRSIKMRYSKSEENNKADIPQFTRNSDFSQSLDYGNDTCSPLPDPITISKDMQSDSISRLHANFISHSCSTPDLTQIAGETKKGAKAKRVDRSNTRRLLGRVRVDTYLESTSSLNQRGDAPSSPHRRSGTVVLNSPRHSGSSLSSRILSSFSRWGERDRDKDVEIKCQGSRTLK